MPYQNLIIEHNEIVSEDGHIYRYSHDYENRKSVYPRIIQIYQHYDCKETYKEAKIPKSINKDVALLDMQATVPENLKNEESIFLRVRRSIEVEEDFGEIKSNTEYVRLQRRGTLGVQTEIALVFIGYNLRKYHANKHRI